MSNGRRGLGFVLSLAAALAPGCHKDTPEAPRPGIGQQTADITADTATLREASAAVNEVVRNATDCDAARAAMPLAITKLDEAASRVRTQAGRTSLDALRAQLQGISQLCPG